VAIFPETEKPKKIVFSATAPRRLTLSSDTIFVTTSCAPAFLYQPTELEIVGNQVSVKVFVSYGIATALCSLLVSVQLGFLDPGFHQYTVEVFTPKTGPEITNGSFTIATDRCIPAKGVSQTVILIDRILRLKTPRTQLEKQGETQHRSCLPVAKPSGLLHNRSEAASTEKRTTAFGRRRAVALLLVPPSSNRQLFLPLRQSRLRGTPGRAMTVV